MPKYFSLTQVKESIKHLNTINSNWLLPSFVFACNGVNSSDFVDLNKGLGTDRFLEKFFSGKPIGLASFPRGGNTLRPMFQELGTITEGKDLVIHQRQKLWANLYSQTGYRTLRNKGLVNLKDGTQSQWKLAANFKQEFEKNIPATFRFEHLLVWIYAFRGIEDSITSWEAMFKHFMKEEHIAPDFPAEFRGRFLMHSDVIWPSDFLSDRPTNEDYQKLLLPSIYTETLTKDSWVSIRDSIQRQMSEKYEGLANSEVEDIANAIVAGIASSRRIFLIGEPGTGKTELAYIIADSFEEIIPSEKLFIAKDPITDKTTEATLMGFCGIDGTWINGSLTSLHGNKSLLTPASEVDNPARRNQVNLILLDEANRKDIESLLAKLQNSLDSKSPDPFDISHRISLGKSGEHFLSPFTYLVMTGNSPKTDEGRVPQSRPFLRRPNLIHIPNPLQRELQDCTVGDFKQLLILFWKKHCVDELNVSEVVSKSIENGLMSSDVHLRVLKDVFATLARFQVGISYGVIEKLLRILAEEVSLGRIFSNALDSSVARGVGSLLSTDTVIDGKSLRESLRNNHPDLEANFPLLTGVIVELMDNLSEYGTVTPFI